HVGIETKAPIVFLPRQLALTNDRLAFGGNQSEALDARGAESQHHDRIRRVTNVQKVGQQKRAEIFTLHRALQSRQAILCQALHVDAEWGEICVEHLSSCYQDCVKTTFMVPFDGVYPKQSRRAQDR